MDGWLLAVIVKPLALLILFGLIVLPLKIAFVKWFPEGKTKRFLLR
jgi:hypothetical protein